MTRRLGRTTVPDELAMKANAIKSFGGRCYLCFPEHGGNGNCENCQGAGVIVLQRVYGGPYKSPPTTAAKGRGEQMRTATTIEGEWYLVNNLGFNCPVCSGSGHLDAAKAAAQARPEPIHF